MAILIKTDGTIVEDIAIDSLAKQQDLVDGYIEYVYKDDKVFIVNEEGLLRSLPINETTANHDTSIYNINDDCVDVMMYPQMYYIQLLKNGIWSYKNIFDKITYEDRKLEVVEDYVYKHVNEDSDRTDFKGYR